MCADNKCTTSVNAIALSGLKEKVSLLQQDLQKIRESTTAAESDISDLENKTPHLISEAHFITIITTGKG